MAGSSEAPSGIPSVNEDLETMIVNVNQVEAHQSDLSPLKKLLLREVELTKWVRIDCESFRPVTCSLIQ